MFKPHSIAEYDEIQHFFIAWSNFVCCGPRYLEVSSQDYHAAKIGRLFTAQTNQAAMLDFLTLWTGPRWWWRLFDTNDIFHIKYIIFLGGTDQISNYYHGGWKFHLALCILKYMTTPSLIWYQLDIFSAIYPYPNAIWQHFKVKTWIAPTQLKGDTFYFQIGQNYPRGLALSSHRGDSVMLKLTEWTKEIIVPTSGHPWLPTYGMSTRLKGNCRH